MQQHSARTRLRSKHRVIPSMFLQNVITEFEEAAVMSELQQVDGKVKNSHPSQQIAKNVKQTKISDSDSDEDDEFDRLDEFGRTKNLDYRFTTQFDDAKKHTRDIFNKVRTAEKVIHNFVSSTPNQYVYGQTLHGGGNKSNAAKSRKLDLANASRRMNANKKALLSESGEVRFGTIDEILREEDLAEMEQNYEDDVGHDDKNENESGNENNDDDGDDDEEEQDDDEVQRLLGDDWRNDDEENGRENADASGNINKKARRQKSLNSHSLHQKILSPSSNNAASNPVLAKRRRLPDLLDVANQVTRRNRAISLLQVSRAMSLQTDNKKAKTMIHFQGGSLLSQRRDIMELQNELQNQIEDGGSNLDSNFIRTGLVSSKCFTTSTDLRCTSREIMAEEYFNPSRNGLFAITTTTAASRRRQQQRKANHSNMREMKFGITEANNNNNDDDDDDDDEDEAERQRSKEEQNRISAKLDFLRAHKPEFLVEDSYRRIDAFIAAEDDSAVTSNLLDGKKMLTPMDFLNNNNNNNSSSSSTPIITAPMYKSKFLQQRRAQQDAEYLLQMQKTNDKNENQQIELSRSATITTKTTAKKSLTSSTGFVSQATVQQALQQRQMDEEHERHLILRNEQQLCRSIIESYRQFHVLSVQPYLDAERRSVILAKECQREIDSLEKKLRVGTHAKEETISASSESGGTKDGKKSSTPTATVGKVSFLNTSAEKKSATENNDEGKNETSFDPRSNTDNKNENNASSSSTITPFKISTSGYSILNSLGEQMDKLRAEDLEEKDERRKRQKMLEEAGENHVLGRHQSASSILLKKMMQEDAEHHQSIVFRTSTHHGTTNSTDQHAMNFEREDEDASDDEEADDDDEEKNNKKRDLSRPPRRVKNTAMMEALRVAQNQQTALALSKLPQLCAFVTLIDDDDESNSAENADDDCNNFKSEDNQARKKSTRSNSLFPIQSEKTAMKRKTNPSLVKYCEYAERFVETQTKERAAFEEKVQTYRLATQQKQQQKTQNNFSNQQRQSPFFFNPNKNSSKNFSGDDQNYARNEQENIQREIDGNCCSNDTTNAITSTIFDDQGNIVASAEQCARLTTPPSCLIASKRWAESHRLLPSKVGGKLRNDMIGKLFSSPTGGLLPVISSSANKFNSEGDHQNQHSSTNNNTNIACFDIFYPRFVAFEEQNARELRERNLMDLQTRVSDISILSRDARLEAGKAKKGVVQCILQQMDFF